VQDNATSKSAATVEAATPYMRPAEATKLLPVSRRTLSNWQARRVIPFYRVGRTVMFKRTDIESALERFRVAAVGEASTTTPRRRRAGRMEHQQ
jgi:excisionase family DNA binding protein